MVDAMIISHPFWMQGLVYGVEGRGYKMGLMTGERVMRLIEYLSGTEYAFSPDEAIGSLVLDLKLGNCEKVDDDARAFVEGDSLKSYRSHPWC